jgi:hypothetical protein
MKIYNKRSRPSASQQAGGCADADADVTKKNPDAARCTDSATYDVFGHGFHVVY